MPEATIIHWLKDVVSGLKHMHGHGIAHRDLKPENLLWCPPAHLRQHRHGGILDGLESATGLDLNRDGTVGGSPRGSRAAAGEQSSPGTSLAASRLSTLGRRSMAGRPLLRLLATNRSIA